MTPLAGTLVADAMVRKPKVCGAATTVGDVRALFADDHVHAVLVTAGSRLLALIDRDDLTAAAADSSPAAELGRLAGRTVAPDAPADAVLRQMTSAGRRRLAVVDPAGSLLGLLCVKRSGTGFCSDDDIQARRNDPRR